MASQSKIAKPGKMPAQTTEEQFKFLISCVRNSISGKVDFSQVAHECGIVTKGAAAKRYERMMRAHGITTKTSPSSFSKVRNGTPLSSNALKRKHNAFKEEDGAAEDDPEDFDVKHEGETLVVKSERESFSGGGEGMAGFPPVNAGGFYDGGHGGSGGLYDVSGGSTNMAGMGSSDGAVRSVGRNSAVRAGSSPLSFVEWDANAGGRDQAILVDDE